MNIFFLSLSPKKAARLLCDKHVVKMILETTQLLCTAIRVIGDLDQVPLGLYAIMYRKTHLNHPMSKWVRTSKDNFCWALQHGLELCFEYTRRYNKIHKSQTILEHIQHYHEQCALQFKQNKLTFRPMCMPDEYRIKGPSLQQDVVDSYWLYYVEEKEYMAKWAHTPNGAPERWLREVGRKRKREE